MAEAADISAWIILFTGFYSLGAAIGELRSPGSWAAMLDDFEGRAGLQFLTGIVVLALGATIYLVNPWNPGDWMSVLVTVLGGGMALEGFIILAWGQAFIHLASKMLGAVNRVWAMFAGVIGIVMICLALLRL